MKARTRFAPSPTGYLHVGGIRTALFAWLVARQTSGQFILRLEDTDKTREVKGSQKHIEESLKWLGLDWDEGIGVGGPYGPYKQSERLKTYQEWGQKLIETGRAYADPYSREEVEAFREAAKLKKQPFLFRNFRPEKPPQWDGTQPLRFKSEPKAYKWDDAVMGKMSAGEEAVDDFIIIKSDGYPTYNFAHIIDDYLMECTHVMRSQEFIASIPKYLNLYEALKIKPPILATLPYVMAPDGKKKLSKRDGAKDVLDYAREGYLPEALVSFMATLGWNDGTEQEVFTKEELIKKFSLDKVQKSGARFDEQRLIWVNGHFIRNLSKKQLEEAAAGFWPKEAKDANEKHKSAILALVQERLKYFAELPELTRFFFTEPLQKDVAELYKSPVDKQLKKIDADTISSLIEALASELEQSDFSEADIAGRLNSLLEKLATKPGILFAVARIAVTGSTNSPQIFGTLAVLGKVTVLERLQKALETSRSY